MKRLAVIFCLIVLLPPVASSAAQSDNPMVEMKTSKGDITIELYPGKAPKTVANYLAYVDKGFYDGTIFHRVIKGFMIQGGGLTRDMQKKPTDAPVANEADNGLENKPGTIAMARTFQPHSATSQFFINTADNQALNFRATSPRGWGYCVFGRVVKGMDTVVSIENSSTAARAGRRDVPVEPIVIESVKRLSKATASDDTE